MNKKMYPYSELHAKDNDTVKIVVYLAIIFVFLMIMVMSA
jgi:hypothetical protein